MWYANKKNILKSLEGPRNFFKERTYLKAAVTMRMMESGCVEEITLLHPQLRTLRRTVPSGATRPLPVWPGPLVDHVHHRMQPVGLKLQQNALAKAKLSGYGEPENANNWQICAMVTATGQNQEDSAE